MRRCLHCRQGTHFPGCCCIEGHDEPVLMITVMRRCFIAASSKAVLKQQALPMLTLR